ncbi:MAG: glycosyltransferase family 4 protein [Ilumatobacter sp.]|nr:glycosyltransferase family 4 protein [Ilumatobacter sp.]
MSRTSLRATDGQSAAARRPIIVICPHFNPDTAPTGIVMTRIVDELVTLGHAVHVVTALPWYRRHAVEPEWIGSWVHVEKTSWGSVTRAHPFPGDDKANLLRRAAGFLAFSMLALIQGLRAGGWFQKADAVIAMSPPLTLGLTGWIVAKMRQAPLIFNIQDVFPDAAIDTGAISNPLVIGAAQRLERISYRAADAVTVLSDDLRDNVAAKMPVAWGKCVHVIPNFVDTTVIVPTDRATNYRTELGLGIEPVVLYAGNVGFSQSLELVLAAAATLPEVTFLINGDGAARSTLELKAVGLKNVHFAGYIEAHRLSELLATGDIHVVPLKAGLGRVSVPSKTYSILAAARPVVAAIDEATAVPRILKSASAGISIPPDDAEALVAALRLLLADPDRCAQMGASGRRWVETHASPTAVGLAYDRLLGQLRVP